MAKQRNNLLGFNGHSTSPFRVPLLIYLGCPVMWRTSGRGQVVSTAGMCPLSKLHGGCIYSTWPQGGSRDRLHRSFMRKPLCTMAAKYFVTALSQMLLNYENVFIYNLEFTMHCFDQLTKMRSKKKYTHYSYLEPVDSQFYIYSTIFTLQFYIQVIWRIRTYFLLCFLLSILILLNICTF